MRYLLSLILLTTVFGCGTISSSKEVSARYEVQFTSTWSASTHPDEFPSSPHFSGLIGAVHSNSVHFWMPGINASQGVKDVAEKGSNTIFVDEINSAISNGSAKSQISADGIAVSPGSVTAEFTVSHDNPLISLISMIAPSPDWFVGVNSLSLFVDGEFLTEKIVTLYCYDSGTDNGISYLSPDLPTSPAVPVFKIEGFPFFYNGDVVPIGNFRFTRVEN